MAFSQFTIASGIYDDEQDLLSWIDFFIVNELKGWKRIKTITNTPTDVNRAYYGDGEAVGAYDRMYLRLQATSNVLRMYVMSDFIEASNTDVFPFGGLSNETELPTGTSSGIFWFIGNKDAVHIVLDHLPTGQTYHAGFGLWESYYTIPEDPKPFYVFGQTAQSQTFESAARLESYGPGSWGTSLDENTKGTARTYFAAHPTQIQRGSPNPRCGEPKLIEPVFYTSSVFGSHEVRGEVPGLYMCGGSPFDHGNIISLSGTLDVDVGEYFIHKHTDAISWAIGPIVSTTTTCIGG